MLNLYHNIGQVSSGVFTSNPVNVLSEECECIREGPQNIYKNDSLDEGFQFQKQI